MNKLIKNPNKSVKKFSKQKTNIQEGKQNKQTKVKPQPSKLLESNCWKPKRKENNSWQYSEEQKTYYQQHDEKERDNTNEQNQ